MHRETIAQSCISFNGFCHKFVFLIATKRHAIRKVIEFVKHEIEFFTLFFSVSRDLFMFSLFCANGKLSLRQEEMRGTITDEHVSRIFFLMLDGGWIYLWVFVTTESFSCRTREKYNFFYSSAVIDKMRRQFFWCTHFDRHMSTQWEPRELRDFFPADK